MNLDSLIGQTLDEKYKIESELGRGGMGAVYLSTHVGTERHVAVKVIVPEFMRRAEFVERFRREARAAGRLRHPNVVDVTDFGFADTPDGRVAYLVMEYLDGCTLGEILDEEKQLPLQWTLDILEQVSSAIYEAHQQGIIHRDLKPDNIWLEPNQRGGYTVKVLDFGIAKLEAVPDELHAHQQILSPTLSTNKTQSLHPPHATVSDENQSQTISENRRGETTAAGEKQTIAEIYNAKTLAAEAGTLIQPQAAASSSSPDEIIDSEAGTAIMQPFVQNATAAGAINEGGTRLISEQVEIGKQPPAFEKKNTAELTRVGAVLGTPLYMSPEQCRGEKLTPQSDIYSLGVIAYRMLSGKTPFTGDYLEVMKAHKETPPPALEAKKVPRKVKKSIALALEKNPANRPLTVEAFASKLRAHSEGIGSLFQRAMVIYSQHLPKFLTLALLIYLPIVILTILQVTVSFLSGSGAIGDVANTIFKVVLTLCTTFLGFFCGYLMFGTNAWLVTQILAAPLRPVNVKLALKQVVRKWKALAWTGMMSSLLTFAGYTLCFFPGLYLSIIWALVAPVVIMEGLRGKAALKRSKTLVKRSLRTTAAAVIIMFMVPFTAASLVAFLSNSAAKTLSEKPPVIIQKADKASGTSNTPVISVPDSKQSDDINIKFDGSKLEVENDPNKKNMGDRLRIALREGLTQILMLPLTILVASFSSIIVALLYLKTRQAGGESMKDLLSQFGETDQPQSKWRQRVHARLEQSGRVTGKT